MQIKSDKYKNLEKCKVEFNREQWFSDLCIFDYIQNEIDFDSTIYTKLSAYYLRNKESKLWKTVYKFVNVTQQGEIFLFHLFPSVGRHHLTWITPEELGRFLQMLGWVLQIAV